MFHDQTLVQILHNVSHKLDLKYSNNNSYFKFLQSLSCKKCHLGKHKTMDAAAKKQLSLSQHVP